MELTISALDTLLAVGMEYVDFSSLRSLSLVSKELRQRVITHAEEGLVKLDHHVRRTPLRMIIPPEFLERYSTVKFFRLRKLEIPAFRTFCLLKLLGELETHRLLLVATESTNQQQALISSLIQLVTLAVQVCIMRVFFEPVE